MNPVIESTLINTISHSPDETDAFAAKLVSRIKGKALVLLRGGRGSGKTSFVRGMCKALGMRELWEVDSPTFTIVNHYPGMTHLDLYRMHDDMEKEGLNVDEILASDDIVAVEWPEKMGSIYYDGPIYLVEIEAVANHENQRVIKISEHWL